MAVKWHGDIDVRVAELNAQHEQLISLFYDLQQAIISNKTAEKIEAILADLASFAELHFATEKQYFKQLNYPATDEHLKDHENFFNMIKALIDNFKGNELKTSLFLIKYLERWINNHVIREDKKYSDHFNRHGLF